MLVEKPEAVTSLAREAAAAAHLNSHIAELDGEGNARRQTRSRGRQSVGLPPDAGGGQAHNLARPHQPRQAPGLGRCQLLWSGWRAYMQATQQCESAAASKIISHHRIKKASSL